MQVTYVVIALDPGKIFYEIEMDGIYTLQSSFNNSVCTAAHNPNSGTFNLYFFCSFAFLFSGTVWVGTRATETCTCSWWVKMIKRFLGYGGRVRAIVYK